MSQATTYAATGLTVQAPDPHPPARYIVIEGAVGAGKTALAQQLASRWDMQTVFERSHDNPFLAQFNVAGARYALPAQLHFLLQRSALSRTIAETDGVGSPLVSDFLPHKSELYARMTLLEDELELYLELAARLEVPRRIPDLVIYLQSDAELLKHRIQRRAIPAEQHLAEHYLQALCRAYDTFFYHYDEAPVLTVNTRHFNPLDSSADMSLLLERITTLRGRKTTFVKGTP